MTWGDTKFFLEEDKYHYGFNVNWRIYLRADVSSGYILGIENLGIKRCSGVNTHALGISPDKNGSKYSGLFDVYIRIFRGSCPFYIDQEDRKIISAIALAECSPIQWRLHRVLANNKAGAPADSLLILFRVNEVETPALLVTSAGVYRYEGCENSGLPIDDHGRIKVLRGG